MHPDAELLRGLVPPPQHPVTVDLGAFQREVGAPPPADFAELMRTYGPGTFDAFLSVHAPDPSKRQNIFARTEIERQINEELAAGVPGFHFPYPIHPAEGGLLKWGQHVSGHRLWWRTEGDPDSWPVLVQQSEGLSFFSYRATATALIADMIEEKIEIPFIPEEEPELEHSFDPLANPDAQ